MRIVLKFEGLAHRHADMRDAFRRARHMAEKMCPDANLVPFFKIKEILGKQRGTG